MNLSAYLTLLLCFFSVVPPHDAQAQLPGRFISGTGYTSTEFLFKDNQHFEYYFQSCTDGLKGLGYYKFKRGKLYLVFEAIDKTVTSTPDVFYMPCREDTAFLTFKFYYPKDFSPVSTVVVSKKDSISGAIIGTASDIDGVAWLKLSAEQLPAKLSISYLRQTNFYVATTGIYLIKFPVEDLVSEFIPAGTVWKYSVKKWNADKLIMKAKGSRRYTIYRRRD